MGKLSVLCVVVTLLSFTFELATVSGRVVEYPPDLGGDVEALRDIFHSMGGAKLWPPSWKTNWMKTEDGICDMYQNWWGTQCYHGRIINVEHRSGMAKGTIPRSINKLTAVTKIDFSYNQLEGTLPEDVSRMQECVAFVFSHNKLSGTIPAGLSKLKKLRYLMLNDNQLTGTIPEELGELENLEGLFLSGNKLTGRIPKSFAKLKKLLHLKLDDNDLYGHIPFDIVTPEMMWLELENNPKLVAVDSQGKQVNLATTEPFANTASLHRLTLDGIDNTNWFVPDGDRGAPLRFMAMGDFGTGGHMFASTRELASAAQFNHYARWVNSSFVVTVGDNFYAGNTPWVGLQDYFRESFEVLYQEKELFRPWYPALGNHDSTWQFQYTKKSERWKQTSSSYTIANITVVGDIKLELHIYDTVKGWSKKGKPLWNEMWTRMLDNPKSRYKIVATHYPIVSSGCHGQMKAARDLNMIIAKSNLTAMFAGHDHHMEYLVHDNIHHFIVGAYSRGPCVTRKHRDMVWGEEVLGGFSYVAVDEYLMNVTFVNQYGAVMRHSSVPYDYARKGRTNTPPSKEMILDYATRGNTRIQWWKGTNYDKESKKQQQRNPTAPPPTTSAPPSTNAPPPTIPPPPTIATVTPPTTAPIAMNAKDPTTDKLVAQLKAKLQASAEKKYEPIKFKKSDPMFTTLGYVGVMAIIAIPVAFWTKASRKGYVLPLVPNNSPADIQTPV